MPGSFPAKCDSVRGQGHPRLPSARTQCIITPLLSAEDSVSLDVSVDGQQHAEDMGLGLIRTRRRKSPSPTALLPDGMQALMRGLPLPETISKQPLR
jgi:hypothetical protein